MPSLLDLPPELRLQIYGLAVSARPNVINIDEGATASEPPRSSTAKALASFDHQLCDELMPLYWSNNIFQTYLLSGMGHYIATDLSFYRFLHDVVKDAAKDIRSLRFKGCYQADIPHARSCIMTVDVDVERQSVVIWNRDGNRCRCEHGVILATKLSNELAKIPRVKGKLQPTLPTLWDVGNVWFSYCSGCRLRLSWEEFERRCGHYGP